MRIVEEVERYRKLSSKVFCVETRYCEHPHFTFFRSNFTLQRGPLQLSDIMSWQKLTLQLDLLQYLSLSVRSFQKSSTRIFNLLLLNSMRIGVQQL